MQEDSTNFVSTGTTEKYQNFISSKVNELLDSTKFLSMSKRYSLFPIEDEQGYEFYKKQEGQDWSANELFFNEDKKDYENLSPELRKIIDTVLAFFSATDGIICQNIAFRFLLEAQTLEEQGFYIMQLKIEFTHSESYSLMINTLVEDPVKRKELFESADTIKCVRDKDLWMEQYMKSNLSHSHRLIAFAAAEGIFFISSFLFIFWFRSKGILQNIISANEMIARDEALHRDFACMKYKRMERLPEPEVHQIIKDAVHIECEFIKEILPNPIEDLNYEVFVKYIKYIADDLLDMLGHNKIWNITSTDIPVWMNSGMEIKQNFYEGMVTNYKKSCLEDSLDWKARIKGKNDSCFDDVGNINF